MQELCSTLVPGQVPGGLPRQTPLVLHDPLNRDHVVLDHAGLPDQEVEVHCDLGRKVVGSSTAKQIARHGRGGG